MTSNVRSAITLTAMQQGAHTIRYTKRAKMKLPCRPRPRVSWVDNDGNRIFGLLLYWDGDFAICWQARTQYRCRILKSNLTYEKG